jgi:hypothetical protein
MDQGFVGSLWPPRRRKDRWQRSESLKAIVRLGDLHRGKFAYAAAAVGQLADTPMASKAASIVA